jgi:uncharacterized membrane protein
MLVLLSGVVTDAFQMSQPLLHKQQQSTNYYNNNKQQQTNNLLRQPQLRLVLHTQLPLIAANDAWGNYALLTGTAAMSQKLALQTPVGRSLGAPVTAMALTFVLASAGITQPGGTIAATTLQWLTLNLATPLILLGADLGGDVPGKCGPLLASFGAAALATFAGCLVGWNLAGRALTTALGTDGLAVAAALLAKNIGGGINYFAVCRVLNASPTAVAAGLCVDNIFALVYFPATSALALSGAKGTVSINTDSESKDTNPTITVQTVSTVLFLASTLVWLGEKIGGVSGALPACTLLTIMFASGAPTKWLAPLRPAADILGTFGLYIFFATAGSPGIVVADSVRASLAPLAVFLSALYSVHSLILFACHFLLRDKYQAFDKTRLLIASSAAIGGPATSVALAQVAGWESLKMPGVLVGNIGYAIATFCGLAYHSFLK